MQVLSDGREGGEKDLSSSEVNGEGCGWHHLAGTLPFTL